MKTILTKQKQWLMPPIIVLPFLFLIFHVLGGGQGTDYTEHDNQENGVNYQLPEADRQIGILDKKEAYKRQSDWSEEKKMEWDVDTTSGVLQVKLSDEFGVEQTQTILARHMKRQEELVKEALGDDSGDSALDPAMDPIKANFRSQKVKPMSSGTTSQRNRENLKRNHSEHPGESLPNTYEAMETLIGSHEILIRQNDSLQKQLQQMQALIMFETSKTASAKRVLTEVKSATQSVLEEPYIISTIMDDCTVRSGNRVRMRLERDILVEGQKIKAGTLIYAMCKTDNERLQLQVTAIANGESYLPVDLSGYDTDGISGLYIPDHAARKAYKDVAGKTNPSVLFTPQGQALSYMGLNAASDMARTMIKTVREKKVHIRKNTLIILKNN